MGNIIYITHYDPDDERSLSGTIHSVYRELKVNKLGISVYHIDGGLVEKSGQLLNRLLRSIGIAVDCRFTTLFAMIVGLYLSFRVMFFPHATIVAIVASHYIPFLITNKKIIYISDATFRASSEIYSYIADMPKWQQTQCDQNEARTLRKSHFILLPSKWAADSAKQHYGISPEKIFQIPFGPNIPIDVIEKYFVPKTAPTEEVRFLFVSADWKRKGGDIAVEICRRLEQNGIKTRLITIGRTPEHITKIDFVDDRGFLLKSNKNQLAEMCLAYKEAHFFLLPTQADASPIVFSEAKAFGVPCIAYDVGGTASTIAHGENGLLLPLGAQPERFVEALMPFIESSARYDELSKNSRQAYIDKAQWSNWRALIIKLMD